jgi:hypothetical protein
MYSVLDYIVVIAFSISLVANLFFLIKIRKLDKAASRILNEISDCLHVLRQDQIYNMTQFNDFSKDVKTAMSTTKFTTHQIYQMMLDQRTQQVPTESVKPNNWDSMKQAFNVPKKVKIDE